MTSSLAPGVAVPLALCLALGACGGGDEPDTAVEVQEQRAEALREAAAQSVPAGAAQLEQLANQHEQKAEVLAEQPGLQPADPSKVTAPIPDSVSVGKGQPTRSPPPQ